MLAVIVLGMGMPTSAAYLVGAIMLAPMLIKLGDDASCSAHVYFLLRRHLDDYPRPSPSRLSRRRPSVNPIFGTPEFRLSRSPFPGS